MCIRRYHYLWPALLVIALGCNGNGSDAPECELEGEFTVTATLTHDNRTDTLKDAAYVLLTDGPELPIACSATVQIIVGGTTITLEETSEGRFEAGYSELDPDLPEIVLQPGEVHAIEVDLLSDSSIEATGTVTLGAIDNFRTLTSTGTEVTFAWDDEGDVDNTTYYVQASDESDFSFPENFASGYVEGSLTIGFGGTSEFEYFSAEGPRYARIQGDTVGTINNSEGRISAWDYPTEPILTY